MADVAIADEDELVAIRELLWGLGVDFVELEKGGRCPDASDPERLLVASVARATSEAFDRPSRRGEARRATWIAVATRESLTQRQRLIASGFDFLVRTPVHPAALRQLLRRALFLGDDLRRVPRVAVGHPVTFRSGWRRRSATLVDLSPRGARIFSPVSMVKGAKISLCLPTPLVREAVELPAVIVRAQMARKESGPADQISIAMRFEPLDMEQRRCVAGLIERLLTGPATLETERAARGTMAGNEAEAEEESDQTPRERRSVYLQAVLAWAQDDDSCLIVGRNLSVGGMCVDDHPALAVGRQVRIALEDRPGQKPFHVGAQVVRNEGDGGIALRFDWIEEGCESRLAALVDELPAIDDLAADGEDDTTASGVLFSRLVHEAGGRVGQTLTSLTGLLRRS